MGADILCVPAAFYRPNSDQWETLIKAASIYNVLPVVAVNQYGEFDNGRGLFGRSMITDAKGIITAGASDKEGYFIGEIDKEFTKNAEDKIRNWITESWIYMKDGIKTIKIQNKSMTGTNIIMVT